MRRMSSTRTTTSMAARRESRRSATRTTPNLPHQSADLEVLFGIAPGVADAAFISTYIDPASTVPGVPSTTPALIAFMQQYDAGQGVDTGLAQDKQNAIAKVGTLTAAEA